MDFRLNRNLEPIALQQAIAGVTAAAGSAMLFAILPPQPAVAGSLLTIALVWLSVVDLKRRLLLDVLTLPLLALGLALAGLGAGPAWHSSVLGAVTGYATIAAVALYYRHARGYEAIGLGDAKLLAALGAWTGLDMLPVIVLVASLLGLAVYGLAPRRNGFDFRAELPFGPFLAAAGWAAYVALHLGVDLAGLAGIY